MKLLNAKLVVSAIGIAVITISPAFAQKTHRHISQQQRMTSEPAGTGRGVFDTVPNVGPAPYYNMVPNAYGPGATGGGSFGYNQALHDNKW